MKKIAILASLVLTNQLFCSDIPTGEDARMSKCGDKGSVHVTIQTKEGASIDVIARENRLDKIESLGIKGFYTAQPEGDVTRTIEQLAKRGDIECAYVDKTVPIAKYDGK